MIVRSTKAANAFTRQNSQAGMFLLILALVFFSLIAIVGIAVDAGNLYRSKVRLQKSLDAGAVAGTYLLGGALTPEAVASTSQQIILANMLEAGLSPVAGSPSAVATTSEVTVNATADVSLLILDLIPGFTSQSRVSATAKALTARTVVSLVLDTTGSMNCPVTGTCTADMMNNPPLVRPPGSPVTKMDKLKEAAISFVNLFDESLDQLALVTFSDNATVRKAMVSPFNKSALTNPTTGIIPLLQASGKTNIEAGVNAGRAEINTALITGARKYLVLVTDGAPNTSGLNPGTAPCPAGYAMNSDDRKYYIKAIKAADNTRADGATVITIGLGSLNNAYDAYQNFNDENSVKSFLLKRMANASGAYGDPAFDCVLSYFNYNSTPGRASGMFLQTPNANDLETLLVTIGKSIKARLTY